ncbi:MAG TPA: alpha/beta fold hydrolase [Pseudoxanthomonas sp.]|nr:alpha/beta fold hydrolase [Pseudoxanthomonas sp.]
MTEAAVQAQPIALTAADGYPLQACRYPAPDARAQLMVAGATAVPQAFYRRFAHYAATRGYSVLTLDYRGIGRSAPARLRGFRMDYLDWARQDLAAAIEWTSGQDLPLYLVGHSYGGHALGLLPRPERVRGAYVFGTGAGWHGWMAPLERVRVLAMWKVLGPLLTRWKGYLPSNLLGLGEDLPLDVYRQWRRWCRYPRYFFDDPTLPGIAAQFARIEVPIVAVNALDDAWAPPRSRDAFMSGYRRAPWEPVDVDPSRLSIKYIGHMGYFRPQAETLWREMLERFDAMAPSVMATPAR